MGVAMWADLPRSFWMIDRWAGHVHTPQIYCFSPFFSVLVMFRDVTLNYWRIFERNVTRVGIFCFSPNEQAC